MAARSFGMTFGPRSLAFRVIAFSTGWAILALIVISTVISTLYRQASERGFDSLLSAHLFNLIGSVGVSGEGELTGSPNLGDLRFSEPEFRLVFFRRAGVGGRDRGNPLDLDDRGYPVAAGRRSAVQCAIPAQLPGRRAGRRGPDRRRERVRARRSKPDRPLPRHGQPHRAGAGDRELRAAAFHLSGAVRPRHDRHQCHGDPVGTAAAQPRAAMRWRWCARARRRGSTAASRPRSSRSPTRPTR